MRARRRIRAAALSAALFGAACGPSATNDDAGNDAGDGTAHTQPADAAAADARADFDAPFEDATEAAGLDFRHVTGGSGAKLLPETMGGGACLFDFDDDGALDLFLVNSGELPGGEAGRDARSALYRGRGDGTFADESGARGADLDVYGMGAAAADFDADGDRDLYVTALGEDVLLVNDGGRFRRADAGLTDPGWRDADGAWHPSWSTAAAWLDADADGDLDLFVGGYCQWTPELEIFTTLDGAEKAFTTPDRYRGLAPRIYANDGTGAFERVVDPALDGAIGKALGVVAWDLDRDGLPEILVANDTRPNFLLRRDADGAWHEEGVAAGVAYDENGRARAGMGIDVADLDGTGEASLAIGNFAGEPISLYRWRGRGFRPTAAVAGLARATIARLTFGLAFADFDLDGRIDLALLNGHIEPDIARFRVGESHAQPGQLFCGRPDGRFVEVTARSGDLALPRVGRGLAVGDVDGDGDLDLVATQNGARTVLLRNLAAERRDRRWVRVRLEGNARNLDALGAEVTLFAGGRAQRRAVRTGSSYLSQGELTVTFGLGPVESPEALEVRWPTGRVERHAAPPLNKVVVLREP